MIIQFLHSGKQYVIRQARTNRGYRFFPADPRSGLFYWSSQNFHRRKYLRTIGNYISPIDRKLYPGQQLVFWGEWEAHSIFHLSQNFTTVDFRPHHIHKPIMSRQRAGSQNTDPFVFGPCFLYSNCLQSHPVMQNLPNDSLILFGSEVCQDNHIRFVLDTVFVVQNSIVINRSNLRTILRSTSDIFADSVLRKIDLQGNHRLYFSTPYSDQRTEYFSFFPCQPYADNVQMQRPVLPTYDFSLKRPGSYQGVHIIHDDSRRYWSTLTTYLMNNGYFLGTSAQLPERVNIDTVNGQHFA